MIGLMGEGKMTEKQLEKDNTLVGYTILHAVRNAPKIDGVWEESMNEQRIGQFLDGLRALCAQHRAGIYLGYKEDSSHWPTITVEFDNHRSYEQLEVDGIEAQVYDQDKQILIVRESHDKDT